MLARRLARTVRAVLALLPVLVAAACSSGPASPEELFTEVQTTLVQKRFGSFWDYLTRDFQQRFTSEMAGTKDVFAKNPGMRENAKKYGYDWQEFLRATPPEIWEHYHSMAQANLTMDGAKIIDRRTDPVNGSDVHLVFETRYGQQFQWTARYESDRGWRLQDAQLVKDR